MIVYRYMCDDDDDCVWYAVNLLYVGFVSFFVAMSAFCYGIYVRYKMTQMSEEDYILSAAYMRRKRAVQQLLVVCTVLVCCFSARVFCFTMTYFHEFDGANIYPWLFYQVINTNLIVSGFTCFLKYNYWLFQVPEFIPHITILIVLSPNDGFFGRMFVFCGSSVDRESVILRDKLMSDSLASTRVVQLSEMKK